MKRTINRGWLLRKAKQGKLLVRCLYHYTDDYAQDAATNFGRMDHFLPAYILPEGTQVFEAPPGTIALTERDFRTTSGQAWHDKDGMKWIIHGNLCYRVKIREEIIL